MQVFHILSWTLAFKKHASTLLVMYSPLHWLPQRPASCWLTIILLTSLAVYNSENIVYKSMLLQLFSQFCIQWHCSFKLAIMGIFAIQKGKNATSHTSTIKSWLVNTYQYNIAYTAYFWIEIILCPCLTGREPRIGNLYLGGTVVT